MPVGTRRKALLGHSSAAALDMNFLTGLPSQAAFARAASATAFDSGGNMVSVAANIPRFDYSATPSGSINWIKNSSMAGASAPTTSPTGWQSATGTTNGMTIVIAGVGTDAGLPYLDLQVSGTCTVAGTLFRFNPYTNGDIPGYDGQTWTLSCYLRLMGGSFQDAGFQLITGEANNAFSILTQTIGPMLQPTSAHIPAQQFSQTYTNGNSATVFNTPALRFNFPSATTYSFTIRIAGLQAQAGSTVATFVSTSTASAGNGSPLGLLIEEQRTNSNRNPRCEGAVTGSPGTLPTFFGGPGTVNGVAQTVVGSGYEMGVPYVDLTYAGTATGTGISWIAFDATGASPSAGQSWTGSVYCRLMAGSTTGLNVINMQLEEHNGTGGTTGSINIMPSLSSMPLAQQRYSLAHTVTGTGVSLIHTLVMQYTSGAAINITIRVGGAQLENPGNIPGVATSLMLPPIGSPATTTRAGDVVTYPTIYDGNAMSMAAEFIQIANTGGNPSYAALFDDGGTMSNYFGVGVAGLSSQPMVVARNSGTSSPHSDTSIALGTIVKVAASMAGVNLICADQGHVYSNAAAAVSLPASANITRFSSRGNAYGPSNTGFFMYLRRVRVWTRALAASELAGVTK